jgi:hypothetical protein
MNHEPPQHSRAFLTRDLKAARPDQRPALQALPRQESPNRKPQTDPLPGVVEDRSAARVHDRTGPNPPGPRWVRVTTAEHGHEWSPTVVHGL